ncbi:MAG: hypothetical protein JSS77_13275 [Acidobacteria bacterium]|nr:hypothetical protein [Acidobacteriota bacterium]
MKVIHQARKHPVISSILGAFGTLIGVWLIGLGMALSAITRPCAPDDIVCDGPAMYAISVVFIYFLRGIIAAFVTAIPLYFLLSFNPVEDDEH